MSATERALFITGQYNGSLMIQRTMISITPLVFLIKKSNMLDTTSHIFTGLPSGNNIDIGVFFGTTSLLSFARRLTP